MSNKEGSYCTYEDDHQIEFFLLAFYSSLSVFLHHVDLEHFKNSYKGKRRQLIIGPKTLLPVSSVMLLVKLSDPEEGFLKSTKVSGICHK